MRARNAFLLTSAIVAVGLLVRGAAAQNGQDAASAETLFRDAKALMEQGNFKDACPKFEASQRLDPGTGTMLNLADCNAKLGKTASAWAQFLEAATLARRAGTQDRADVASARAKALEPRLVRVRLIVTDAAKAPGLEVRRDGVLVDPATWGSNTPTDPGTHLFKATAPGKQEWDRKLEVVGEGGSVDVAVPVLADAAPEPKASAAALPPPPPMMSASTAPPPPPPPPSGDGQKIAGIVVGGLGVVSIGVGSVLGGIASSNWSSAHCTNKICPNDAAQSKAKSAKSDATGSTVTFIVGGALIAGGAALFFTAGSGDAKTGATTQPFVALAPTVSPTSAGLHLQGAF